MLFDDYYDWYKQTRDFAISNKDIVFVFRNIQVPSNTQPTISLLSTNVQAFPKFQISSFLMHPQILITTASNIYVI